MTKILFVCTSNNDRSVTAEYLYSNHPGLEVKSAGLATKPPQTPVSTELLQWADVVLCMEEWHKTAIEDCYAACIEGKVIDYLDVQHQYPYLYPDLLEIIKKKVDAWLKNYDSKIQ